MQVWVVITDTPVYMCERGGVRRGECGLRRVISFVIYVSLTALDRLCQFGLRKPMHLCTSVREEGGNREGTGEDGDTQVGASSSELYFTTV